MNVIEILKEKDTNKKYITNYKGEEMIVKVVECCGGEYDMVRVIKSDEREYRDKGLTEFMYMSEIVNLEFEEIVDWSKIPIDTLVEVSDDGEKFIKRHFAKYERGMIFVWGDGRSSKTAYSENDVVKWEIANIIRE